MANRRIFSACALSAETGGKEKGGACKSENSKKVEMMRGENSPEDPEAIGGEQTAMVSFVEDKGAAPSQLQTPETQGWG